MNIKILITLVNFIILLISINLLKYYFLYIIICLLCGYLFIRILLVLKIFFLLFFFKNILYSLLNIYLNFQLFMGKCYNLFKFCFDTYQQNILKNFLIMNLYRLIIINLLELLKIFKSQFAMTIEFFDIQNYIGYIIKINFILNYV